MTELDGDYKVKVKKTREIPTGEKQELQLVDKETDEVVKTQWVSFSTHQLKDGYEDRVKHWAEMRIRELESSDKPDHEGKRIEI